MDILSRGKMKIILLFLEFMHAKYIVMRKGKIVILRAPYFWCSVILFVSRSGIKVFSSQKNKLLLWL